MEDYEVTTVGVDGIIILGGHEYIAAQGGHLHSQEHLVLANDAHCCIAVWLGHHIRNRKDDATRFRVHRRDRPDAVHGAGPSLKGKCPRRRTSADAWRLRM